MSSSPKSAFARCVRRSSSRDERGSPIIAERRPTREPLVAPPIAFSAAVSPCHRPSPCNVRPMPNDARRSGRTRSKILPSYETVPAVGRTNPQITLNSVVLPAPLGPMMPTTSPGRRSIETSSSAMSPPKLAVTPRTSRPSLNAVLSSPPPRVGPLRVTLSSRFLTRPDMVDDMARTAPDDVHEITALVMGYAERLDLGDFEGVAALFVDATYRASTPNGIISQRGAESLLSTMRALIVTHEGVPATKHVTTNLIIDVASDRTSAACRSYFTVMQALSSGIQPVVAGRYHDQFVRDPDGWRFSDRLIFTDLMGDLSRHLRGNVLS